jgi:putative Mg2+ transporter-C (MgtC) family protein
MPEIFIKLSLAVLFGAIIGFEREYSSKAAGFRTITMISLGSCLFTMLSLKIGSLQSHDHIAANIITGIGFIGAGVIFKDGFNVSGLTTASTIWVSAAMGMALGIGEYVIAGFTLGLSIVVLAMFEKVQDMIEQFHQVRTYRINFVNDYAGPKQKVEEQMNELGVGFKIKKVMQTGEAVSFFYNVSGRQQQLDRFSELLLGMIEVKSFEE